VVNVHPLRHHVVFQGGFRGLISAFRISWEDEVLFCCLVWWDVLICLHLGHTQPVLRQERHGKSSSENTMLFRSWSCH